MSKQIQFNILRQETFTASDMMLDDQALTELGGCSDNGSELGLGAWQIEFDVEVTNQENDTKKFTVVFQPEERSDGMKNYSGYDVAPATLYGCDADESGKLEAFCDYDDSVINALRDIAWKKAKEEHINLTS